MQNPFEWQKLSQFLDNLQIEVKYLGHVIFPLKLAESIFF